MACAEGGGNILTQCIAAAYRAGGGQVDAGGIPDGKGYTAPRLSPAQVRQQDNAARQAEQQAAADLKAAARATPGKTGGARNPADGGLGGCSAGFLGNELMGQHVCVSVNSSAGRELVYQYTHGEAPKIGASRCPSGMVLSSSTGCVPATSPVGQVVVKNQHSNPAGIIAGLTILNLLQGGADPVTDTVELAELAAEDAGAAAGEGAGDHIVLGKSLGLEARAAKIGGRTLMNDPGWQATLLRGIADPSTKISVTLDDVAGGSSVYGRVMSAVQRAASGRGSPFDWEMQQLYNANQLLRTDFWEGGQLLENPFSQG